MGMAIAGRTCATASAAPRRSRWRRPRMDSPAACWQECHVDPSGGQPHGREEAGVTGERLALGTRYERRPRLGRGRGSGPGLRLSDGVLDVAEALLGVALDLPTLAADLLLLVPGHLAEPLLDLALSLAQRALDVLICHGILPSAVLSLVVRTPLRSRRAPAPVPRAFRRPMPASRPSQITS